MQGGVGEYIGYYGFLFISFTTSLQHFESLPFSQLKVKNHHHAEQRFCFSLQVFVPKPGHLPLISKFSMHV